MRFVFEQGFLASEARTQGRGAVREYMVFGIFLAIAPWGHLGAPWVLDTKHALKAASKKYQEDKNDTESKPKVPESLKMTQEARLGHWPAGLSETLTYNGYTMAHQSLVSPLINILIYGHILAIFPIGSY